MKEKSLFQLWSTIREWAAFAFFLFLSFFLCLSLSFFLCLSLSFFLCLSLFLSLFHSINSATSEIFPGKALEPWFEPLTAGFRSKSLCYAAPSYHPTLWVLVNIFYAQRPIIQTSLWQLATSWLKLVSVICHFLN